MKKLLAPALIALTAAPAFAATDEHGAFISLTNTDFVVWVAFLIFVGILFFYQVPKMIGGLLDRRAEGIKAELDEARALREEAQTILASYERKQKEVAEQANQIVEHAKKEASAAAEVAKKDLKSSIARRLAAAEDQIASAEAAAVKEVRDTAITVAIGAASDLIAKQMDAAAANKMIEDSITDLEGKLH